MLPDILKQQGHFYALNALAYSPDGQSMVTGGDDGKVRTTACLPCFVACEGQGLTADVCLARLQVKVWSTSTGFCFVTFKDHSAAVTDLAFIGGKTSAGSAVHMHSLTHSLTHTCFIANCWLRPLQTHACFVVGRFLPGCDCISGWHCACL